jgi:GTP-binding protein
VESWRIVRSELDSYGAGLGDKSEIIALTKADLLDNKKRAKLAKSLEKESGAKVFPISAPLEEGMESLLDAIIERLGSDVQAEEREAAHEGNWSPL